MSHSRAVFSVDLETPQYTAAYRNADLQISDPVGLEAVKVVLSLLDDHGITAMFLSSERSRQTIRISSPTSRPQATR